MGKGTLLYAQSGGVTAVINATAGAVIEAARAKKVKVLAARNGILGVLREDLDPARPGRLDDGAGGGVDHGGHAAGLRVEERSLAHGFPGFR